MKIKIFSRTAGWRAVAFATLIGALATGTGTSALAAPIAGSDASGPGASTAKATVLSDADSSLIGQRLTTLTSELDAAFLVSPSAGVPAPKLLKPNATPLQAASVLRKSLALGSSAAAGVAAEAQESLSDRSALEASGSSVTRSSATLQDLIVSSASGGQVQLTANVYVRRQISGSALPWEEVIPYALTFDAKSKAINVLKAENDLASVEAKSQGDLVTDPSASQGSTGSTAAFTSRAVIKPALLSRSAVMSVQTAAIGSSGKERAAAYADQYRQNYAVGYPASAMTARTLRRRHFGTVGGQIIGSSQLRVPAAPGR